MPLPIRPLSVVSLSQISAESSELPVQVCGSPALTVLQSMGETRWVQDVHEVGTQITIEYTQKSRSL